MEPADLPPKQRATSYADAVRGHKVFSQKSKPEGGKLTENSLPLKESSVIEEPRGVAQKQPQKKGTNLAQAKGSIPGPKDSQQGSSQAKQPRKDSHLKSSYAKTRDVREGQVTPQFSYAEAVKGKTLLRTPQLTDSEGHKAGPASPAPSNVPIPESPPEASPSSQCKQPDDGIGSSNKPSGDVVVWQGDNRISCHQAWPDEASGFVHHHAVGFVTEKASHNHPAYMRSSHAKRHAHHGRSGGGKGQAIMAQSESKRRKMAEERDERQARLIYCHDLGLISLWESQYEWDVLVTCGKYSWRLHHDILCRESEWFKARLPPKDPNGGYVTFDCNGHDEKQLANALYFMYLRTCEYEPGLHLRSALDGRPLQRAVFAYLAAASVAHPRAQAAALRALHAAARRLRLFFDRTPPQTVRALDLAPLHAPLAAALAMAFEQGPALRPVLAPPAASPSASSFGDDGCGDGEGGEREEKEEEEKKEEEKKEEEKKEEEKKEEEKKEEEKKEEEKKEEEKKEEEKKEEEKKEEEKKEEEKKEEEKKEEEEKEEEKEKKEKEKKKEKEEERETQETERADMVPLRAALAHLCDVALPWLALNEGFVETLMTEWMPGLWMNVVSDAIWFGAQGVLDEMWAVLEEAIAPREHKTAAAPGAGLGGDGVGGAGDGAEDGRPTSGSKKRRRNAEEEEEREEELQSPGEFEIWRDGQPGEPATPPRWRRPQRREDETDDRMINGERLSPEQQREVAKENLLAPTERGAGGPPRGGVGRGMLQLRHNFTDPDPGLHSSGHDSDGNEARRGRGDDWDVRNTAGDAMSHNGVDRVVRNMALLR
ncbi:hypothetical protein MYCTH_2106642 [Thermothelomyces thermophilus ATCC 42464]|uniref:BTB domain-containing protein n=1 Tax=Thermothelomyces thermophilus (strain ATCC 42464 / BCRC 31852 / DSM 1799) TaxID=573729 RepID=G2Q5X4_THET4|nr:uncharacterized protein MYCTH_2106642 [Thermothelomyces thermophilus ATCC 42464]AEO53850.1 hypothetical protein MYCTH_2106642 [Thermothelomyces thermophilus ATCC 42464]